MSIEESPEFEKALFEACEKQFRGHLFGGGYAKASSKDTIAATMEEVKRQREHMMREIDGALAHSEKMVREAKIQTHPHMRDITANLKRKYGGGKGLVCPVCGEGDQGNRMNEKPVCLMNDKHKQQGVKGPVLLLTPEKAEKWDAPKKDKKRNYTFNEPEGVTRK